MALKNRPEIHDALTEAFGNAENGLRYVGRLAERFYDHMKSPVKSAGLNQSGVFSNKPQAQQPEQSSPTQKPPELKGP